MVHFCKNEMPHTSLTVIFTKNQHLRGQRYNEYHELVDGEEDWLTHQDSTLNLQNRVN